MKQKISSEPSVTIVLAEGEVAKGKAYETEIDRPDGATHAIVLVESLSGAAEATVEVSTETDTDEQREELSRFKRVQLRFIQLASSAESVVLRVTSKSKAMVRVTIAFFKREAASLKRNFSCRACKQLCRLAVSALLAHLGIPYLDAEATIDMPGVKVPDETTGAPAKWSSISDLLKSTQNDSTVPVLVGNPVSLDSECRNILERPDTAPSWVRDMFDLVDPKAIAAVRVALEAVDWVFDATDRLYTSACESIGMCKAQVG